MIATTINLWHQRRTLFNAGSEFERRANEVLHDEIMKFNERIERGSPRRSSTGSLAVCDLEEFSQKSDQDAEFIDEEKVLAGRPDANIPAMLTKGRAGRLKELARVVRMNSPPRRHSSPT